jgi:hypothetical protein
VARRVLLLAGIAGAAAGLSDWKRELERAARVEGEGKAGPKGAPGYSAGT